MHLFATLYALGWAVHLASQAQASVQAKSNGITTMRQWIRLNAPVLYVRVLLVVASFLIWLETPNLFGEALGHGLPMTYGTCLFAGFCVDSFWDKMTFLTGLKVDIPTLVPPTTGGTP